MRIKKFIKLSILIPLFSAHAQNGHILEFNTKTEPIDNGSIKQTEIGMQIFKNISIDNALKNTFKYKSTTITDEIENYLMENYSSNYSSTHFNSFINVFELTHQFSQKTKLNVSFEPTVNFEQSISIADVTILGGIEISQMLSKNNSIELGIKRMTVFGKPQIMPTVSFNHQFNKNAYLKLGFPNSALSCSSSSRDSFSLRNDFSGSINNLSSSIIADDKSISKVGFSQMETTLQYERNIDNSWFVNFIGGYSTRKEFKFWNENSTTEINQALKNGSIFSISIKYKL